MGGDRNGRPRTDYSLTAGFFKIFIAPIVYGRL
jgi:hypothetical protein